MAMIDLPAAIRRLADRVFHLEEINGGERCPTYLYRWTLFKPRRPRALWRGFGIYLHKFVGDDWSRDLHDHPKRFISIGLKGAYTEHTPNYDHDDAVCGCESAALWCPLNPFATEVEPYNLRRTYRAPWVRTFPANHIHRITLCEDRQPCWTLVIILRSVREWGFWHQGQWIHWKDYVRGSASHIADKMRACL